MVETKLNNDQIEILNDYLTKQFPNEPDAERSVANLLSPVTANDLGIEDDQRAKAYEVLFMDTFRTHKAIKYNTSKYVYRSGDYTILLDKDIVDRFQKCLGKIDQEYIDLAVERYAVGNLFVGHSDVVSKMLEAEMIRDIHCYEETDSD